MKRRNFLLAASAILIGRGLLHPLPALGEVTHSKNEVAVLAGGCFWCLEAVFLEVKGVRKVVSGYSGGTVSSPNYQQVCSGNTGHAECVQVTFDPSEISYTQILEVFFSIHDPTTLNRQGDDRGTQYRSAIFYKSPAQKKAAQAAVAKLKPKFNDPIVTEINPLDQFFVAESYHQNYFARNPGNAYCSSVVHPKVDKFRSKHPTMLKK